MAVMVMSYAQGVGVGGTLSRPCLYSVSDWLESSEEVRARNGQGG